MMEKYAQDELGNLVAKGLAVEGKQATSVRFCCSLAGEAFAEVEYLSTPPTLDQSVRIDTKAILIERLANLIEFANIAGINFETDVVPEAIALRLSRFRLANPNGCSPPAVSTSIVPC